MEFRIVFHVKGGPADKINRATRTVQFPFRMGSGKVAAAVATT